MHTIQADITTLPAEFNVSAYHGDEWSIVFQLNDQANTPHDLTGGSLNCDAEDNTGGLTPLTVAAGADPTTGTVTISPPTAGLAAGVYRYDLVVGTDPRGTLSYTTWARGQLTVVPDITP
jgi:hypothetical protein